MLTDFANGDESRNSFWPRVREFAVPPSMIDTATARRRVGDWAGACAAAGFDVDIDLRSLAREFGHELANRVRGDLRHLAPDLLRWHMPRVAPDGLLRPGLTIALARYDPLECETPCGAVHLVVRTAPTWAEAGQRIELALWAASDARTGRHPHPRPNRRFRLDLHRHLWDARRADELRMRCGAGGSGGDDSRVDPGLLGMVPAGRHAAIGRWAAEARMLLDAEGAREDTFLLRLGTRRQVVAELVGSDAGHVAVRRAAHPAGTVTALPILPDAATWMPPDVELLRSGAISADRLHPLVAAALLPDYTPGESAWDPGRSGQPLLVECGAARHRLGLVDGVLTALDHDPAELAREHLLIALTGNPLPCLRVIDQAHRDPDCLQGIRDRLDHGDTAGALAVITDLLGAEAALRDGALRDELQASAKRRITYGLYRAGLTGSAPNAPARRRPTDRRAHPRHASTR
ncbi:hypothetical protein VMT65_11690 [Nocardia sp. CDC153]|uniref:hypothetical protein n=1 Tax=Nocardia sp. CDC153 TaxID=3112167 RepID=UPI002DB6BC0A|nr:hypothetical protein [Nocardia sp. CDC153]MEC3953697.1 hypothetical protein [Nocardia sp. CDC153]